MAAVTIVVSTLALIVTLVVGVSMLRHPVLWRMGLRNFGRRKGNTAAQR